MTTSLPQVRVGTSVFILKHPSPSSNPSNPTFLIGKRKSSHGAGTYGLPGGHIDFGEQSIESSAAREVLEETGLRLQESSVRLLTATNDYFEGEGKHYVTLFMVAMREDEGEEAKVLEPEKCEGWEWMCWEDMMRDVERDGGNERWFLPIVNLLRQRGGIVPGMMGLL